MVTLWSDVHCNCPHAVFEHVTYVRRNAGGVHTCSELLTSRLWPTSISCLASTDCPASAAASMRLAAQTVCVVRRRLAAVWHFYSADVQWRHLAAIDWGYCEDSLWVS